MDFGLERKRASVELCSRPDLLQCVYSVLLCVNLLTGRSDASDVEKSNLITLNITRNAKPSI